MFLSHTFRALFAGRDFGTIADVRGESFAAFAAIPARTRRTEILLLLTTADGPVISHITVVGIKIYFSSSLISYANPIQKLGAAAAARGTRLIFFSFFVSFLFSFYLLRSMNWWSM